MLILLLASAGSALPVSLDVMHIAGLMQRLNQDRLVPIFERPAQDRREGVASGLTAASTKPKYSAIVPRPRWGACARLVAE